MLCCSTSYGKVLPKGAVDRFRHYRRNGSFTALVRRGLLAIILGYILLSACAESPLRGELDYATKACAVPPMSGILRGDRSALAIGKTNMQGWSIEITKEFFEIPAQKYTEYSQQWDIYHEDLERACRTFQICKAQNRTLGSCSKEANDYAEQQGKARAFMVALHIIALPAEDRSRLQSVQDIAMQVVLGSSEASTLKGALQKKPLSAKAIDPEEILLKDQLPH